jgi:hypothetical protein
MPSYKVHIFKTSNNFIVNSLAGIPASDTIEYIMVAGGGGGGRAGGGGGAGGFLTGNITLSSSNTYVITVGSGGGSSTPTVANGISGGNTSAFGILAYGGGAGGGSGAPGFNGGSGGGGGHSSSTPQPGGKGVYPGSPFISSDRQGYDGGASKSTPSYANGGGGGASVAGEGIRPDGVGGAGGRGANVNWVPTSYGTPGPAAGRYFSGGGGGGGWAPVGTNSTGGAGGGGAGRAADGVTATSGTVNTGGGGGGGSIGGAGSTSGSGGSGIVILKYPLPIDVVSSIQPKISRVSNIVANVSTVTTGDLVSFTISTVNAANGEVLYYSTNNQPNAAFTSGNVGSFEINDNVGYITLGITAGGLDEEFFDLQIRRNSISGPVLRQGGNVFIDIPTYLEATGGLVEDENGYRIHVFTTSGEFNVTYIPENSSNLEIILVGGGGGGGSAVSPGDFAGGGGAGGFLTANVINVSPGPYSIIIGAGGYRGNVYNVNPGGRRGPGGNGSNTTAFGYTAWGGGGGAGFSITAGPGSNPTRNGLTGGSGGGGGRGGDSPRRGTGGQGITWDGVVQGYPGGTGFSPPGGANPGWEAGAGGGGAGEAGQNGGTPAAFLSQNLNTRGAKGGNGLPVVWLSNISYGTPGFSPGRWFAGGGGGGVFASSTFNAEGREPWLPVGGVGGGGSGWPLANNPSNPYGSIAPWYRTEDTGAGNVNTGGGGGGGVSLGADVSRIEGSGGSGIVIIRYPYE